MFKKISIIVSFVVFAFSANAQDFSDYTQVNYGVTYNKWVELNTKVINDVKVVNDCKNTPFNCNEPSIKILSIVNSVKSDDLKTKVALINREINSKIKYVSDTNKYNKEDYWASPLETIKNMSGDCEDYAILKMVTFIEAGVSKENIFVVLVKNKLTNEGHAVIIVRFNDVWYTYDLSTLNTPKFSDVKNYDINSVFNMEW